MFVQSGKSSNETSSIPRPRGCPRYVEKHMFITIYIELAERIKTVD